MRFLSLFVLLPWQAAVAQKDVRVSDDGESDLSGVSATEGGDTGTADDYVLRLIRFRTGLGRSRLNQMNRMTVLMTRQATRAR